MTETVLKQLISTYDEPEHLPALAEMTSKMIVKCAEKCFQSKKPKEAHRRETPRFSKQLYEAHISHKKVCQDWRNAGRPKDAEHPAKQAKLKSQRKIQKIVREEEANKAQTNHNDLMLTHDKNLSDVCKKLKKICGEHSKISPIPEIQTFLGSYKSQNVLEGFRANTEHLCNEKSDKNFSEDFLKRCEDDLILINEMSEYEDLEIPPITLEKLKEIIHKKLKKNKACDLYQLTPEHLKFVGEKSLELLCILLNRILTNLSYLKAPEFKMAIASVIHKGKNKPKNHHKSYRLVRICPLLGRLIDEYLRPIAVKITMPLQSDNQYGFSENITYLMGALQRHETQNFCTDNKRTFFGCSLDGDSAFEVVCRTIQKRELYFSGECGQLSRYNQSSYENTETRIKMQGKISRTLAETLGVGQGKIRSSDHYKIYINPALETLESAELGVNIGPLNSGISCVADDLYLMSDDQTKLQGLLDLAQHYGQMYRVTYGANKTVISIVGSKQDMDYYKDIQPWNMDTQQVSVKDDNEHLGLIVSGIKEEEKNVDLKVKKARGALFKLLGPAFSSKCLLSPALQIHLYRTYVCPIARSGLSAMTLRESHTAALSMFQKKAIRGFLHLSQRSPIPSLFFLTGELPIIAKLHRDVYSIFYNIWINPQTKIFKIVKYLLQNCAENSHTWCRHIRNISIIYDIEDPAKLIKQTPPSKSEFKNYVTTKITIYHEKQLRLDSMKNSKMGYLNVSIKGLNGRVHPALSGIISTHTVRKARAHIKMLCDDIYTFKRKYEYEGGSPHCRLCFDPNNPQSTAQQSEDIEHILAQCSYYKDIRERILFQMEILCRKSVSDINFKFILTNNHLTTQFILDCTSLNLPERINPNDEICPLIFNLGRDLCYSISKKRTENLKKLNL